MPSASYSGDAFGCAQGSHGWFESAAARSCNGAGFMEVPMPSIDKFHFTSTRTIKQVWESDYYTGEQLSTASRFVVAKTKYDSYHAYPIWEVKGEDIDHTINYVMAILKVAYPSDKLSVSVHLPMTRGSFARYISNISALICDNIAKRIQRASEPTVQE